VTLLLAVVTVLADRGWMHEGDDFGSGGWVLMMLGMLLFWGLLVAGAVWLVRSGTGHQHLAAPPEPPLAILQRRLADGSITPEEYERRRRILLGESDPGAGAPG